MRTVVLGERPIELDALIRHRAVIGADTHDEVWEGEYHMAPAPNGAHAALEAELAVVLSPLAKRAGLFSRGALNLGNLNDYRVPDWSLLRHPESLTWYETAALVVENVSPGDESWQKFMFYAAHEVDEVVIVEPRDRSVRWFRREGREYEPVEHSSLLDISVADVVGQIDWPPPVAD